MSSPNKRKKVKPATPSPKRLKKECEQDEKDQVEKEAPTVVEELDDNLEGEKKAPKSKSDSSKKKKKSKKKQVDKLDEDTNNMIEAEKEESTSTSKSTRKKKKSKKKDVDTDVEGDEELNNEVQEPQMEQTANDEETEETSDEDDDDDDLLAAAAAWAETQGDDDEAANTPTQSGEAKLHENVDPSTLSLHVTQLPYDATELDIRRQMAQHGCVIASVRMVYDRDERGRKTVFRGVAFVDLLDTDSYETALALNRKLSIRGRTLNIRPTKSKRELADIVSRTQVLVQEKIKKQREKGEKDSATSPKSKSDKKEKNDKSKKGKSPKKNYAEKDKRIDKKSKSPKKKESTNKPENDEVKPRKSDLAVKVKASDKNKSAKPSRKESVTKKGTNAKATPRAKDPDRKLTKQERNRRAAIIMAIKRGKKMPPKHRK
eukprot:Nitzschia sp. Nitz4//scaffold216_size36101//22273//23565//NITZ4_007782-RA/size36101-processed-gene-0.46-mRNA-1//-1//CDS//3329542197//3129//frame0